VFQIKRLEGVQPKIKIQGRFRCERQRQGYLGEVSAGVARDREMRVRDAAVSCLVFAIQEADCSRYF